MDDKKFFNLLKKYNAFFEGDHFVYTSGKHGSSYINKDALYLHPHVIFKLSKIIALRFKKKNIDVVLGPATGGIVLSHLVATHLRKLTKKDVLSTYADKANNGFILKRGYDRAVAGKRVLIVEDILNTGGSMKKLLKALKKIDCEVVGIACLCDRGNISKDDLGVNLLWSIASLNLKVYIPRKCPMCLNKIPINKNLGKGV